ncbi:MAG: hypothetical protein HC895_25550 [Leptolyngbyaceae cyanobacterium SM1_3_5]|nr:hypothetical protein [Leptolyngbyaceae cyanobacterium SM1_3_5]
MKIKQFITTKVRNLGAFIAVFGLACSPTLASAATNLQTEITTGRDDLRGGNTASISLVLVNGTVLPEQILSRGLGSGSRITSPVSFPRTVSATQIRSIRIRHDGNPRPGNPFDTYDNWDLQALRISLTDAGFRPIAPLYDSARDSRYGGSIARFTGSLREITIPIRAIGTEPDFVITAIERTPGGLRVTIRNIGLGTGRLTNVSCWTSARTISRFASNTLVAGGSITVPVSFVPPVGGTVTCAPSGVDASGNPEAVTANNNFSRRF